jgi:hypothetical protein
VAELSLDLLTGFICLEDLLDRLLFGFSEENEEVPSVFIEEVDRGRFELFWADVDGLGVSVGFTVGDGEFCVFDFVELDYGLKTLQLILMSHRHKKPSSLLRIILYQRSLLYINKLYILQLQQLRNIQYLPFLSIN